MKNIILLIPALCIAGFTHAQSIGPSTLNSAGGKATIGTNTFEYSIGEMAVVSTNTAGTITITHGVLQPNANKADNITDIEYAKFNLNIYPNPASNEVNIAIVNNAVFLVSIQLYDITGKMIQNIAKPVLQNGVCKIAIAEYAVGNYLLKVTTNLNSTTHQSAFTISKSN
jgi:Secretion system C-terminal sorting domain